MKSLIRAYIRFFQYDLHGAILRRRLKALDSRIQGKLVDVGAGDSPYRNLFTDVEYITTNARGHYPENHPISRVTDVWIEDASSLPFDDSSMDAVLCFQVLSVLQEPKAFFNEANRLLKPDGKLILSTDWLYPSWSTHDVGRYSADSLKKMVEDCGFKVQDVQSMGAQRTLLYMLRIRWLVGYSDRLKKARGFQKLWRLVIYSIHLLLLPWYACTGLVAFLSEKHISDSCGQTYGLLLIAEKPKS